jgi:hypothetical protein
MEFIRSLIDEYSTSKQQSLNIILTGQSFYSYPSRFSRHVVPIIIQQPISNLIYLIYLDFTKLLSASSELLSQLPITNETKQAVYNIIMKIVNGKVTLRIGVDELGQILIVSNTGEVENVPSIGVC